MSIRAVRTGIDQLVAAGFVLKTPGKGGDNSNTTSYKLILPVNGDSPVRVDSLLNPNSLVHADSPTGESACTPPVNGGSPKPDKELDKEHWSPPDGINLQAWTEFEQHRREIKKPLSDLSRKKAVQVLIGKPFDEQQQMVDLTIANRWTGLFPLKTAQHQQSSKADPYPTRKKESVNAYL